VEYVYHVLAEQQRRLVTFGSSHSIWQELNMAQVLVQNRVHRHADFARVVKTSAWS